MSKASLLEEEKKLIELLSLIPICFLFFTAVDFVCSLGFVLVLLIFFFIYFVGGGVAVRLQNILLLVK